MSSFAGRWLTGVFIAVTAAMLWASFGLSRVSGWIPRVVLAATLLLLMWQAVLDWRAAAAGEAGLDEARRRTGERAAVLWITGLLLAAWLLGVIAGSMLFCLAWLRWHAGERWPACLVFAAVFGAVLWLVFAVLLGADLYPGWLGGRLF